MASLIQQVVHCAKTTYRLPWNSKEFEAGLVRLRGLVNLLTANDLGLQNSEALRDQAAQNQPNVQPRLTYINVFENPDVSIGVFIIHPNAVIPLHNHPKMYGIVKCLHGKIRLTSFTQKTNEEIGELTLPNILTVPGQYKFEFEKGIVFPSSPDQAGGSGTTINKESSCSFLTPKLRNYHELRTVSGEGPAAFIDILAPPYSMDDYTGEDRRDCDFFKVESLPTSQGDVEDQSTTWLRLVEVPENYFCDYEDYNGPVVE